MPTPPLDADQKLEILRYIRNLVLPVVAVVGVASGIIGFSVAQYLRNEVLETKLPSVAEIAVSLERTKAAEASAIRSAAAVAKTEKQVRERDAIIRSVTDAASGGDPEKLAEALSRVPGFSEAAYGKLATEMASRFDLSVSIRNCLGSGTAENPRTCMCDEGLWAMSGGADSDGKAGLVLRTSYPSYKGRGWTTECSHPGSSDNVKCEKIYALCVGLGGPAT